MNRDQIIHLSRVRAGLRGAGITLDVVRAAAEPDYLHPMLLQAADLNDEAVVDSAIALLVDFGFAKGMSDRGPSTPMVEDLPINPDMLRDEKGMPTLMEFGGDDEEEFEEEESVASDPHVKARFNDEDN